MSAAFESSRNLKESPSIDRPKGYDEHFGDKRKVSESIPEDMSAEQYRDKLVSDTGSAQVGVEATLNVLHEYVDENMSLEQAASAAKEGTLVAMVGDEENSASILLSLAEKLSSATRMVLDAKKQLGSADETLVASLMLEQEQELGSSELREKRQEKQTELKERAETASSQLEQVKKYVDQQLALERDENIEVARKAAHDRANKQAEEAGF